MKAVSARDQGIADHLNKVLRDNAATQGEKIAALRGLDRLKKKYGIDFEKRPTLSKEPKRTQPQRQQRPTAPKKRPEPKPKEAPKASTGHKIHIDFTEPECTDNQFAYIRSICRFYGIPEPTGKPTWTDAHDWLNTWSVKYRRDRASTEFAKNFWRDVHSWGDDWG
jgi:hypothetical protein